MRNEWNGVWHNQYGSEIVLEQGADGRLTGRLVVEKRGKSETFALTGVAHGELVSFSVDWGKHGAVTAWVGHMLPGADGPVIEAMWHMAVHVPHPERSEERWRSVWTGADSFRRGAGKKPVDRAQRVGPQPLWLL
jgi:hypothetical protein